MKTEIIASLTFGAIVLSLAAVEKPPMPDGMDIAEYIERCENGRLVEKPGTGYGILLIHNQQKRVSEETFHQAMTQIRYDIPIHYVVTNEAVKANITIAVVEKDGAEPLSVYPDSCRAMIDVAALAKDNPKTEILATRARKEIMRAFAFLGGAAGGAEGLLMDAMTDYGRLDKADERLPGDMVLKCNKFLERCGVKTWEVNCYRSACEQGFAPQPRDAFEKYIWDQVHSVPSNPIKIKYNPNKAK